MVNNRGVTIRLALLVGLVATAFGYLVLRIWTGRGGAMPPASWGALLVLVFMAFGVFFAALPVRRFLRGQARKSLNPIRAMRIVVLAQASALTGALITGWYLSQMLLLVPDLDIASRRALALRLAALAVGGVLMVVAGLLAQAMCRVDKGRGNREGHRDRGDEQEPDGSQDSHRGY